MSGGVGRRSDAFPPPYTVAEPIKVSLHRERRERIATAVLAGFAVDPTAGLDMKGPRSAAELAARMAVEWADALIRELDK